MTYYDYDGCRILRERMYEALGIPYSDNQITVPPPDALRVSEKHPLFDTYRMNRKIMGAFRYGRFNTEKPVWDRISAIEVKIKTYKIDGNDEHLLDIANYAELEFVEGMHPKKHFKFNDDTGHHCTIQ